MRAAIFHSPGTPLAIETVPDPEPGEGEAVIRVGRCGVCGTDLHSTSGHGYTLPDGSPIGHEYAGEVVAVGRGVEALKIGDRVAGMPIVGCGECAHCRTGIDFLCSRYRRYAHGLAEYARVHERGAMKLPDTISLADGALVEPLAVGRRAVRLAAPIRDAKVVIIGPGPIGLAVLFWLRNLGVENVALLATSLRRRALAEAMGAAHFVLEDEHADEVMCQALGGPADFVFECAGTPGVLGRTVQLVRPQGLIIALGFGMTPDPIVPSQALRKDLTIRFSVTYDRGDFAAAADALSKDGDRARALVTTAVPLSDAPAAFEALRTGATGPGKLVIDLWG
jgi:threonine dehydrogenase-like Zn-dependent dehydrogenase